MPSLIEDFNAAFADRSMDVTALKQDSRRIGRMHLGGIVIECLIKYIIVKHYGISQRENIHTWLCTQNMSNLRNGVLNNPKHRLNNGIQAVDILRNQVDSKIVEMVETLQRPLGVDYIDLRYCARSVTDQELEEWEKSYKAIRKWLIRVLRNI